MDDAISLNWLITLFYNPDGNGFPNTCKLVMNVLSHRTFIVYGVYRSFGITEEAEILGRYTGCPKIDGPFNRVQ